MQSSDSKTGQTFSWGTREDTVYRPAFARADVQVTCEGIDPAWFEIVDVTVTEPKSHSGEVKKTRRASGRSGTGAEASC
jgi:hypothetical protein